MAPVPFEDYGDARGEMDRLFAEMPGAPIALMLMVATRGRLGYVAARDDPLRAADGVTGVLGAPGTPRRAIEGGMDPMTEPAGSEASPPPGRRTRARGDAPSQTRGAPHPSFGTGGD